MDSVAPFTFMPFTLKNAGSSELIIKKSRFLGWVGACAGKEQAQQILQEAWREHPDATHVCWALMAGGHSAANDDGEPGGTAGRPMLEVLRHHDLEGVLALAVRYYGGTPLGAGGLVRAYTDTVVKALDQTEKIKIRPVCDRCLGVPYELEGQVRRELIAYEAVLQSVQHLEHVQMHVQLPQDRFLEFEQKIQNISHGKALWLEAAPTSPTKPHAPT